jgi:uncharacterized protein
MSPACGPSAASSSPRIAAALLVVGVLSALVMDGRGVPFEERFIYFPSRALVATPADLGIPFEEVRFGPEGRLHGWFIPGSRDVTVLWFHGNAGNISHRVPMISTLRRELGVSIFIFDYSGYGLSGGRPSERATADDARAALAYLRGRGDVDHGRIVYFGKSLGAAVAVGLAAEEPPYRLVAQSAFTSIGDMARLHYPWLPLGGLLTTRYDTLERIKDVRTPVLVVHGDRDAIAPLEHGRRLYEAAPEPKRLLVVEGGGHNDVLEVGGRAYLATLREFLTADWSPSGRVSATMAESSEAAAEDRDSSLRSE